MISFASQRAGGQDLATHLRKADDNFYVEVAQVRGAIARDLHGAFSEWEAQAAALTRCRQYLCSLSINPDELQGRLTREQYIDYIDRAEAKLGLSGQPRAVVFHIKPDEHGRMREHGHVVWSRIDAVRGRAVQLSFFKEKLMTVTREFARDHGLELPDGYRRHEDKVRRRNRQLSGYDCIKQKETGISHEERMAAVTAAWIRSDDGKAFVNALADLGYILARGRNEKRPILVDFYGHTSALTRLIDDPAVKTKHVRERLGPDYAPENLPSEEEAQTLAAERRKAIEEFEKARSESEEVDELLRQQLERRKKLDAAFAALKADQKAKREKLAEEHKAARRALHSDYLVDQARVDAERSQRAPKGLPGFLSRVSGIALITKKVQRYRDRQRLRLYLARKRELSERQHQQHQTLVQRHQLQAGDMGRQLKALDQVEKRERASQAQQRRRERRQRINARHAHMPPLPPGGNSRAEETTGDTGKPPVRAQALTSLIEEFVGAAEEGDGDDDGDDGEGESDGDDSRAAKPTPIAQIERQQQMDLTRSFNIAADPDPPADGGDEGIAPESIDPDPDDSDPDEPRPERKRPPDGRP